MSRTFVAAALFLAAAALAACQQDTQAPRDKGVCWHLVQKEGEPPKFNQVAVNQQSLEYCAARLELMRRNFVALGSRRTEIVGAYQGRFIFIDRRGIFSSKTLNGNRYLALVRTGDGRLAVPGAMPQQP
jgi:hypothetical protein